MIQIIVMTVDASAAAHVGGPVHVEYRTFDVEAPEVEAFMAEKQRGGPLVQRSFVGVAIAQPPSGDTER